MVKQLIAQWRLSLLLTTLFAALAASVLFSVSGCESNPIADADRTSQRAFASYGLFVVMEERAASLMQSPSVSDDVKIRIQSLDARLKPMADDLRDAALLYERVSAAVAEGETTQARLDTVAMNLERWVSDFVPILNDFKTEVLRQ